ncbi:hypothetical protein CN97_00190 [Haematobacter massiliensis]|uniref:Uncharacterized protein n=1 Tax=Haematobacter massiliensis TaxID=195105 RepID=A0A086Y0G6_9RHOB|nr:hypothetical protein CN97_00190 [Haematobacter massiliensis]OWJ83185.1 hypothetical protein CDV51_16740 [Haematobacter massiliensis]
MTVTSMDTLSGNRSVAITRDMRRCSKHCGLLFFQIVYVQLLRFVRVMRFLSMTATTLWGKYYHVGPWLMPMRMRW